MAKYTTEDYLALDVRRLVREGLICEYSISTSLTWSISGRKLGSIRIETGREKIRLIYTYNKTEELDYIVRLDKTACNYGGFRYWFICPRCFRRVAILYGGRYFYCRLCHDLTYRSCQQHDKRFAFFKKSIDKYSNYDIMRLKQYVDKLEKIL